MDNVDQRSFKTVSDRKAIKLNKLLPTDPEPIKISNKYINLPVEEIIERKDPKPTPIIIKRNFSNHSQLVDTLKLNAPNGFHMKFTNNTTNLYVKDMEDKKKITEQLKLDEINFYTFTEKNDKTHAFVLRGLDSEPDIEDIKEELEKLNVYVKNIYRMRNTKRPLFLIITSTETTLHKLQSNVRFICYTKVSWERHNNKKLIILCHRCQSWKHVTANCLVRSRSSNKGMQKRSKHTS